MTADRTVNTTKVQWRCWFCSHWFDLDKKHEHYQTGRPDRGDRRTAPQTDGQSS